LLSTLKPELPAPNLVMLARQDDGPPVVKSLDSGLALLDEQERRSDAPIGCWPPLDIQLVKLNSFRQ